jgi:hypothetical protein
MTTVHEAAMALCEAVERFFGRCQPETHPLCGCIVCQARALRAALASEPTVKDSLTVPDREARRKAARDELTRDPIFLLQSARLVVTDPGFFDAAEKLSEDGELSAADEKSLIERDLAALSWDTESVWFTREEAEVFRASHAYRWHSGSRVYCVCAEGALAKVLTDADTTPAREAHIAAIVERLAVLPRDSEYAVAAFTEASKEEK